ncbi:hypothetical protein V1460_20095 [Streptomyces sp. SCSIO 30461]|uniref:hypothetical protein n=1 Tax=Streptomyces sp. SCSIO 30461 TaxID=3118085 RepID=UPI0030CC2357
MMKKRSVAAVLGSLAVLGAVLSAGGTATAAPAKYDQATAAALLKEAGITWTSSGNCNDRDTTTCTSFDQINKTTVNGIIGFKNLSKCGITITGGTEKGHASGTYSHWNGYKVDIRPNTCVDDWIKKNMKYDGKRSDGAPMYKSVAGNVYAKESSHWDILYVV